VVLRGDAEVMPDTGVTIFVMCDSQDKAHTDPCM